MENEHEEYDDMETLSYEQGAERLEDEKLWFLAVNENRDLITKTWKESSTSKGKSAEFGLRAYGSVVDAIKRLARDRYPVSIDGAKYLVNWVSWDTVWKHWNVNLVEY